MSPSSHVAPGKSYKNLLISLLTNMTELPAQFHQLKEIYLLRLILIVLPQGEGEISWLVDWAKRLSEAGLGRVAWLAIASSNHEPFQFWRDLVASLQFVDSKFGESLNNEQESGESFCLDLCIEALINSLAEEDEDYFLVFENYHLIDHQEIHSAVQLFIDYLPERVHIVIVSQEEPPLQISRLRVRRQILEILIDKTAD